MKVCSESTSGISIVGATGSVLMSGFCVGFAAALSPPDRLPPYVRGYHQRTLKATAITMHICPTEQSHGHLKVWRPTSLPAFKNNRRPMGTPWWNPRGEEKGAFFHPESSFVT
ncbi:hypothetical protein ACOMHN_009183 [Nucella lapillus]